MTQKKKRKKTTTKRRTVKARKKPRRYRILMAVFVLSMVGAVVSFVLSALDKNPVSEVTIAFITILGTTIAAILAANTADHKSANENGIDIETDGDEGSE